PEYLDHALDARVWHLNADDQRENERDQHRHSHQCTLPCAIACDRRVPPSDPIGQIRMWRAHRPVSLWRHPRPCCPARPYFWTSAGETALATTPSTWALGVF